MCLGKELCGLDCGFFVVVVEWRRKLFFINIPPYSLGTSIWYHCNISALIKTRAFIAHGHVMMEQKEKYSQLASCPVQAKWFSFVCDLLLMKTISAFNVHCNSKENQCLEPLKKFNITEVAWVLMSGIKRMANLNVVGEEAQGCPSRDTVTILCHRFLFECVLDSCAGAPWVKFRGRSGVTRGNSEPWYWRPRGELRREVKWMPFSVEKGKKAHRKVEKITLRIASSHCF